MTRTPEHYQLWLERIDQMVTTDFVAEMEMKILPNSIPYTQEEAKEMASLLATVYSWSHRSHCDACAASPKP